MVAPAFSCTHPLSVSRGPHLSSQGPRLAVYTVLMERPCGTSGQLITATMPQFPHLNSVLIAQDFIGCPQDYNRAVLDTGSVTEWETD